MIPAYRMDKKTRLYHTIRSCFGELKSRGMTCAFRFEDNENQSISFPQSSVSVGAL